MRKALFFVAIFFTCSLAVRAQTTLVTGTIIDPNGLPYAGAKVKAQLVSATGPVTGQPTVTISSNAQCASAGQGSAPCQIPFPGTAGPVTADVNGKFTLALQDNALVTPAATQWFFTVTETPGIPPPAGTGPQSFSVSITITGTSQDVSAALNAAAPALSNIVGGGGNPSGSAGDLQLKQSNVAFGASGLNDNGTVLSMKRDLSARGPNPFVDIRQFGARAVNVNLIPSTTASISAGSSTATLASASTFQNGDGITIWGAGPAHSMPTPGAPTVTPSVAEVGTGTGMVVNAPAGTTTFNYEIVARDKNGGLTAASPAGNTTTGNALGAQSVSLTSCSRSNTTVTCVTSAPHGLVVNAQIHISGTVDPSGANADASFGGWYLVATVPDTTHFTFTSGLDSRNGAPTSSTGGTVHWFNCNHITWSAVTGAWEYFIYSDRASPGTFALIGVSWPQGISTNLFFDDFGATMMNGATFPAWVPTTAPSSATSDALTTTILGGAGTTTLALANSASTTVSGAQAAFDDSPLILAAANGVGNGRPAIYIPNSGGTSTCFIVSSYLTLPSQLSIVQAGCLWLNDTIETASSLRWIGDIYPYGHTGPAFSQMGYNAIATNAAHPGVYANHNNNVYFKGLDFTSAGNQSNAVFADQVNTFVAEKVNFTSSNNSTDYMGIPLFLNGILTNTTFPIYLSNVGVFTGAQALTDQTATPALFCNFCGILSWSNANISARGVLYRLGQGGTDIHIDHGRDQGGILPLLTVTSIGGGQSAAIELSGLELDTMANAMYASLGPNVQDNVIIDGGNAPSSGFAVTTGNATNTLTVLNNKAVLGQNINALQSIAGTTLDGILGTAGTVGSYPVMQSLQSITVPSNYQFVSRGSAVTGLSCTVAAGGSVPVGTFSYTVYPVFANGAEGEKSAPFSVTTTTGNQTVNCSWTAPSGSPIGYDVARNGQKITTSTPMTTTTSYSDTQSFTGGGTATTLPVGGPSGINSNLAWAPKIVIGSVPFASLGTPVNGTIVYCPDCTIANPCAGAGTGALAKRINGVWVCN
jgi:hypothetical protein